VKHTFTYDWLAQYQALDGTTQKQITAKLKEIDRSPSWPHESLKGKQFKGLFKLRIADYRLIYQLRDGEIMDFLYLGHRREVYE